MSRIAAIYLTLLGATCMSLVGLCIRLIESADGFQILFYRSFSMSLLIMMVICLRRKIFPKFFLNTLDINDLMMGTSLSFAFFSYVFAMLNTSVASTLLLLSTSPIIAGIIGWVWIGEKPIKTTWFSMIISFIGILIMFNEGLEIGRLLGNSLALLSALFFAFTLVLARRSKKQDVLGGTFLGAFFSFLYGLILAVIFGNGFTLSHYDFWLIIFMGFFTIGLGVALVTWATPFLPAAEVSLLVLLESILGPLWVWFFVGERMTFSEILGGMIVLSAVILLIYSKHKKEKALIKL